MKRKNIIPIKTSGTIILVLSIIVLLFILNWSGVWLLDYSIHTDKITTTLLSLLWTIVMAFIALYLYIKNNLDEERNYLELNLNVIAENNYLKIRTEATNSTKFDRDIAFAFLLITKTNSDLLATVNDKFQTNFEKSNDFISLKNNQLFSDNDFAFIPLPYYFSENVHVGNEKLLFEIPLQSSINESNLTFFDARFFVFRNANDLNGLHRSVSVSFALSGGLKIENIKKSLNSNFKNKNEKKTRNNY